MTVKSASDIRQHLALPNADDAPPAIDRLDPSEDPPPAPNEASSEPPPTFAHPHDGDDERGGDG